MENFIEKFAELFEEINPELLDCDTRFKELDEWSSLIALALISMVDEEYDVVINGEDIRNAVKIGDLYNKILEKR